jgi:hypothetical protein
MASSNSTTPRWDRGIWVKNVSWLLVMFLSHSVFIREEMERAREDQQAQYEQLDNTYNVTALLLKRSSHQHVTESVAPVMQGRPQEKYSKCSAEVQSPWLVWELVLFYFLVQSVGPKPNCFSLSNKTDNFPTTFLSFFNSFYLLYSVWRDPQRSQTTPRYFRYCLLVT